MKGVDAILASVLILLISITAIFMALQLGRPATQKSQDILLMNEGQDNLISIDNAVRDVLTEGEGSVRVLRFSISGGEYEIDNSTNSVQFSMESESQIIAEGVSKTENGINFTNSGGTIYLNLTYADVQIIGEGNFGRGYQTLTVRNDGFNETTQKQMVYISLNPVAPANLFTNQYNQTKTLVIEGTNVTSPTSLNDLGINTYDILEGLEYGGQSNYSQIETANITGFNTTPADFTNSINNQNYNVTSTVGQPSGPAVNRYNQTQTTVMFGANTTSPSTLNAIDGQTYNVTESAVPQINQSSNLQAGTIRDRVIGAPILTGNKTPSNWGKSLNNWFNQSNITLSDNKWTYAFTQNAGEDWYNFGFNVPAGSVIYGIRGIVEYSSNTTSATQCLLNISNNNGTSYAPMATLSSSSVTDANTTLGTYSRLWGLNWNPSNINAAGGLMIETNKTQSQGTRMFRIDTLTLDVNYSPPVTDLNTTYITYNNVRSGSFLIINNISVTVNVSSYNNTGSARKSSNPDLWLEVWNGTIWSVVGNMSVKGTGNFTAYVPNQDNIYLNWSDSSTQRNIRIMGRYFDANDTTYDEINWTAVWVTINYSNNFRAEIEHNATGISWYGNLNSINVSVNFTTNVTSVFNLSIYNFNTGVWNYSVCQNGTATVNTWYNWWCNVTNNPSYYNSSDFKIRVRLNETNHSSLGLLREEYVQYYVGYITPPQYSNISVEQNSSPISESPSIITKINVTTILKTNISSGIPFTFYIYNFSSGLWEQCSQASINTSYSKMECVETKPSDYISSDGKIRIRVNSSGSTNTHQMMEDYLSYQITKQNQYRMEVESNVTRASLSGILYGISVSLNFSTNCTNSPAFGISIYNFSSNGWTSCDSLTPSANLWYARWCNVTLDPSDYLSGGTIRVRLNETPHQNFSEVKEDYIQYYVIYTQ